MIDIPPEVLDRVSPDTPGSDDPERYADDPELEAIEALVGTDFDGRYGIIEELARGGMGIVFRAEHLSLGRPVVIKVLKAAQVGSSTARARFEREARRACQLDHPNVVTVHDFGYHDELGYLVMEYVDGLTVYEYIKKYGPMTFLQFAPVAAGVLSGLSEAHRHEIIHRDIKASNIMLTFDGGRLRRVKLLDFGLAKVEGSEEDDVTKKSNLIGTMGAMPPERILCKPTDCRVDLYAFGICAYRMITGRRPFVGDDMNVLYQHVHEHPPPLTDMLPADAEYPLMVLEWVHRLLAKEPGDRPRDATQARDWLLETVKDTSIFRIDEVDVDWLTNERTSTVSSDQIEVTSPSWSVDPAPSGSYRSLAGRTDAAAMVAQLRDEPAGATMTRARIPWTIGLGVAGMIALGALGVVAIAGDGGGDDGAEHEVSNRGLSDESGSSGETATTASDSKVAAAAAAKNGDIDRVFEHIQNEMDRGAYGTAENLLDSVRDELGTNPVFQVRAAEYQARIDIKKNLRRAKQAEKNLKIERAIAMYDEILSLDAGNTEANEGHQSLTGKVVLKVTSDPLGEVLVDSEPVGRTPLEKLVSADFSRVEVRAPGYRNRAWSLIPDGGTRVELSARLEKERGGDRARPASKTKTKQPRADKVESDEPKGDGLSNEDLMEMK